MTGVPPVATAKASGRLGTVDFLRAFAAISVAWFHFTNGNASFLARGFLKSSGRLGWLGVEIFFVVSGFIIPYSLHRGGYQLRYHWKQFLAKRIIRLDPPYFAAIVIAVLLIYLSAASPAFRGQSPNITVGQLLRHLGYLNAFTRGDWVNPVFWTLAIEFQFYLLISFIFPLLVHRAEWVRLAALGALAILALAIPSTPILFQWLALFGMGIIGFQYFAGLIGLTRFMVLLSAMTAVSYFAVGFLPTTAGLIAAIPIALVRIRQTRLISFLSAVSYSLYLLHVPIGGRVVNIGMRLPQTLPVRLLTLVVAMASSLVAAYLFYRWVELPAQRWSSRIRYLPVKRAESAVRAELEGTPTPLPVSEIS